MADRDLTLSFFGKDVSAGAVAEALAAKLKALESIQDDNDASAKRLTKSTGELHNRGFKPLLDTALLLGPAIVPIGAAALAAGVGLAGLGAAGILAFTGIKREMKEGTPLGKQYADTFKPVVDEFHALQTIAAAGVFTGISRGIESATTAFPGLNKEMAMLSVRLGSIGGNVGAAFVNIFQQLEPLFGTVASQLDRGSASLLRWSQSSDGVGKFIRYAQDSLPKVEETLGALVTAFGKIAEAAAPLGGVALSAITNLANAISRIPVPVLTGLLVALQVGRIVAIASSLAKLGEGAAVAGAGLRAFVAGGASLPVVAAGLIAVGVAAELMHGSVSKFLPQVGVNINDLQRQSDAAGKSFKESANTFGTDVTNAYTQGGDAAKSAGFKAALAAADIGIVSTAMQLTQTNAVDMAVALTGTDQQWQTFKNNALNSAIATQGSGEHIAHMGLELDALRQKFIDGKIDGETYNAALKAAGFNADGSVAGINNLTDAQLRGKDAADAQKQSIMQLTAEISKFQSQAISGQQSQLGLNDALAHAKENTDQSSHSLSANTDAGRTNQQWVLTQIGKINAIADATLQQTGSTKQATDSLHTNEDALRRAAAAAGLNKGEVDALIRTYANVPANVTTYLKTVDGASGVIRGVDGQLRAMDGRVVYTTIVTQHTDIYTVQDAAGNRGPAGVTSRNATGGWLSEGWNIVNEVGPEWMLKRGSNVMVYPHGTGGPATTGGGQVVVNVSVAGSVVTQRDLVQAVTAGVDDLRRRRGRVSVLDV